MKAQTPGKEYALLINVTEEKDRYDGHWVLKFQLPVVRVEQGAKIRNLSNSWGDEPLADFSVKAYVMEQYESVSADPAFFDCYKVERRDAKRMTAVFMKLDKGLEKLTDTLGHVQDFGAQVARIAVALGIGKIVRTVQTNGSSSYDEQEHRFYTVGQGVAVLNGLVAEFRERHPLPVNETETVTA